MCVVDQRLFLCVASIVLQVQATGIQLTILDMYDHRIPAQSEVEYKIAIEDGRESVQRGNIEH